jgi:DNA relaxase NicK
MNRSDDRVVEQITAGVDWLTMTLPDAIYKEEAWYMKGIHELSEIRAQGYELKERCMLGFDGYSVGNCFVGGNHDRIMMQFTGHHANHAYDWLYRGDAHISRIDLQVTVKYTIMPKGIAKEAYRAASAANRKLPDHRRRKLWIIVGSDGGDTLYLGSASSKQRGRLYNKEVQSEEPSFVRTWRYECVFRDATATMVAANIAQGTGTTAPRILDWVTTWWSARGVDCSHIESGRKLVIPISRTQPTDVEAKLKWLRTQVRPTIKYLVELEMHEELSEALGVQIGARKPDSEQECR